MPDLKPRTAEVLLYQGDDLARIAELRQAAEVARRKVEDHEESSGPRRGGDEIPSADAEKRAYDEFVAEAAERAVIVRLQMIGRAPFKSLVEKHPPREVEVTKTNDQGKEETSTRTHEDDAPFGVNVETFADELLTFDEKGRRTILEPEFDTAGALRDFLDLQISEGDYDTLWVTAFYLNRQGPQDPKLRGYGTASQSSSET